MAMAMAMAMATFRILFLTYKVFFFLPVFFFCIEQIYDSFNFSVTFRLGHYLNSFSNVYTTSHINYAENIS